MGRFAVWSIVIAEGGYVVFTAPDSRAWLGPVVVALVYLAGLMLAGME